MPRAAPDRNLPRTALLFAPGVQGGIAHYAHYQAEELQRRGVAVTMLCSAAFPWPQDRAHYRQMRRLPVIHGNTIAAKIRRQLSSIASHYRLAWEVFRQRPDFVLLDANTEYHALLWIWPHLLLRVFGVIYLAVFHDPHRAVRYGLPWLHRLELGAFYLALRGGLIHGEPPPQAWLPSWLHLRPAPHGPFPHQETAPAFNLREQLGIGPDRFVLLSFGLITPYKNIDLLIAALAQVPEADLIIAGRAKSGMDHLAGLYLGAAAIHGVADRVHLADRYIPEEEVSAFFAAADAVALTYNRAFVSQSGVLQLAAGAEKPVLASGGSGPLCETVSQHGIGLVIEPDSVCAIVTGLRELMNDSPITTANFRRYKQAVSWEANVAVLLRLHADISD